MWVPEEWINIWYIYKVEYYSAIKMNETEIVKLTEVNQSEIS